MQQQQQRSIFEQFENQQQLLRMFWWFIKIPKICIRFYTASKELLEIFNEQQYDYQKSFTTFTKKNDLRLALEIYNRNPDEATDVYGPIETWYIGDSITNFDNLFKNLDNFNGVVKYWKTSQVTSFIYTFLNTKSFNQEIEQWDIRNASNFLGMFNDATNFNQSLNK
jgi:hypothetical protein